MLTNTHPMDLASEEISPEASQYIGDYLESSALLGDRTARMHAVLAGGNGDPNFTPEPFTTQERLALYNQLAHHVDIVLQLLRNSKEPEAHTVLASENQIHQRFDPLLHQNITALRIRHHGDFHLGQVLYTGDDFLIIDYEGEPARTLAERRRKNLAMRDVAGMIRSFQYAAYAALPERNSRLASYAAFWTGWVSASFLRSYFRTADGLPFMPASSEERRLLLDVFLLEKALYEVSYELNNRPDWVNIPLRGILSLLT